jgi:hypothetical protein
MQEIIGVMPEGFHSVDEVEPSLILPFKFDRNKIWLGNFSYPAVARFKPGATVAQARCPWCRGRGGRHAGLIWEARTGMELAATQRAPLEPGE